MLGSWGETANNPKRIARSWPGIELRVSAFNPVYEADLPFVGQGFSATFNDSRQNVGQLLFWVLRSNKTMQSYELEILMDDWLSGDAKEVASRLSCSDIKISKSPSVVVTDFDVKEEYRLVSLEITFDYLHKDVLAKLPESELSQIIIDEPVYRKAPDSPSLVSRLVKKDKTPVLIIKSNEGVKSHIEETYYEF